MSQNFITIGGRNFTFATPGETTAEQDIAISNVIRATGVKDVQVGEFDPSDEKSMEAAYQAYIDQATIRVWESGRTWDLIAAMSSEEGKDFSMADMKANAKFFASAKGADDKLKLQGLVAMAVMGFFEAARPSSMTFPKFSRETLKAAEVDPSTENGEQLTLATGQL